PRHTPALVALPSVLGARATDHQRDPSIHAFEPLILLRAGSQPADGAEVCVGARRPAVQADGAAGGGAHLGAAEVAGGGQVAELDTGHGFPRVIRRLVLLGAVAPPQSQSPSRAGGEHAGGRFSTRGVPTWFRVTTSRPRWRVPSSSCRPAPSS